MLFLHLMLLAMEVQATLKEFHSLRHHRRLGANYWLMNSHMLPSLPQCKSLLKEVSTKLASTAALCCPFCWPTKGLGNSLHWNNSTKLLPLKMRAELLQCHREQALLDSLFLQHSSWFGGAKLTQWFEHFFWFVYGVVIQRRYSSWCTWRVFTPLSVIFFKR